MFHLFFALFMAFACPKYNNNFNGAAATLNTPQPDTGGGVGGEGGHVPPDH